MKIFCKSREAARNLKNGKDDRKVIDCKGKESQNGSRWAIVLK